MASSPLPAAPRCRPSAAPGVCRAISDLPSVDLSADEAGEQDTRSQSELGRWPIAVHLRRKAANPGPFTGSPGFAVYPRRVARLKGTNIVHTRRYVEESFGLEGWATVAAGMSVQ